MSAISAVKPPRKVVIAIDPSTDEGQHTADWAIDNVLDPSRDQLEIVSAISLDSEFDATELGSDTMTVSDYLMEMEKQIEQKATEALGQFADLFRSHNISTEIRMLKSRTDSRNVIVDYTNGAKADLLILGSRDLSGWKRVFLGSFSDYVQAHVHCPVLIVKENRATSPVVVSA